MRDRERCAGLEGAGDEDTTNIDKSPTIIVKRMFWETARHPKRGVAISLYNSTKGYNTILDVYKSPRIYTV